MSNTDTYTLHPSASALIRNEPVQARSTARLATLLDSAAAVIDEIGYEKLTTAMVAERAGASIGTVYRYFPDRIAVLQSLASRNLERLMVRVSEKLSRAEHASAQDALLAVVDVMVDLFRTEPGFRSLRAGDVLDLLPPTTEEPASVVVATAVGDALAERFGVADTAEFRLAVGSAVEVADALVARAFARSSSGDEALVAEARRSVAAVVADRL
ncbi:TetR family transcriptional regulator [Microcella pacifica]|uniref:TetR/AcrR family transcriptional regulator n=1 Tax=Microcella pacifica TaxID=2591847 RepID=A0A9E5JQ68_9MICO|nr:TetR/AcrR family transcriptional regulator [Microcella pacifica]NHF63642.1 TetR/AcrR family transcriptional regulator [Microcella pacifica]